MKVGDKVIITTEKKYSGTVLGQIGEIVKIYNEYTSIAVKINTFYNRTSKEGLFYFTKDELRPMPNEPLNTIKLVLNSFYGTGAYENVYSTSTDCKSSIDNDLKRIENLVAMMPKIKDVKFNNPATIVFWSDNTKTVVKAHEENFDPEKGLTMAITKKLFGNTKEYYYKIKHWTKKYKGGNK